MSVGMKEKDSITAKIEEALAQIRPYLESDGGDISLVEVTKDLTVKGRTPRCVQLLFHERNDHEGRRGRSNQKGDS